jgi:hypothetical protein
MSKLPKIRIEPWFSDQGYDPKAEADETLKALEDGKPVNVYAMGRLIMRAIPMSEPALLRVHLAQLFTEDRRTGEIHATGYDCPRDRLQDIANIERKATFNRAMAQAGKMGLFKRERQYRYGQRERGSDSLQSTWPKWLRSCYAVSENVHEETLVRAERVSTEHAERVSTNNKERARLTDKEVTAKVRKDRIRSAASPPPNNETNGHRQDWPSHLRASDGDINLDAADPSSNLKASSNGSGKHHLKTSSSSSKFLGAGSSLKKKGGGGELQKQPKPIQLKPIQPNAKKKTQQAEYLALPAEEVRAAKKRTDKRLAAGHLFRHRSKRDERTGKREWFDDVTEMTAQRLQASGNRVANKLKAKGPTWDDRAWYTGYVQAIWDALAERGEKPIFDRPEGDPVKMNGGTFPAEPGTTEFKSWDRIAVVDGGSNALMLKLDPAELDIPACYLPHELRCNYPHVRLVDSPSGRKLWRALAADGCVPDGDKAENRLLTEVLSGVRSVGAIDEDAHPDFIAEVIWLSWHKVKAEEAKRLNDEQEKAEEEKRRQELKAKREEEETRRQELIKAKHEEYLKAEQSKAQETVIKPFSNGLPF